jgi:protein-disulfide isomerase
MAKRSSKNPTKGNASAKSGGSKSRFSARREEKKQQEKQRNLMLSIGALVIVGAVIFIAVVGGVNPPPDVAEERLTLDPILGAADAPVQIIEYGSYGCHACEQFHNSGVIDRILADYPGQVSFTFRDLPIISPAYDNRAAQIAQCALDQSEDGYWQFHNALYEQNMSGSATGELLDLGGSLGLDRDALETCFDGRTHVLTVDYDLDRARDLGLNSTPAFFVNGQRMFSPSESALRNTIDAALAS